MAVGTFLDRRPVRPIGLHAFDTLRNRLRGRLHHDRAARRGFNNRHVRGCASSGRHGVCHTYDAVKIEGLMALIGGIGAAEARLDALTGRGIMRFHVHVAIDPHHGLAQAALLRCLTLVAALQATNHRLCRQEPVGHQAHQNGVAIVLLVGRLHGHGKVIFILEIVFNRRAAANEARPKCEQRQSGDREDDAENGGHQARRISAEHESRQLQHDVAEYTAKAGRQRPGCVGCKAAGNTCRKHPAEEPNRRTRRLAIDAMARHQQHAPDRQRHENGQCGQTEELRREIGENSAGIADRIGDRIVGGMAEARIGNIPGRQRRHAERGQTKQG